MPSLNALIKQYEHDVDYFTRLQEINQNDERNLAWIEPLLRQAAQRLEDALAEEERLPYLPWYIITASAGILLALIALVYYLWDMK